ncbi:MAG: 3-dehydroquinate synthase [Armatimonadia bacterium]|nr:3-dehydroquinate synthase [Armatimonadia bacterium]
MTRLRPPAEAIALTGFMGTGKTTVGRTLAGRLGLEFVDTDEIIEDAAGRTIPEIFADEGEGRFREAETRALLRALEVPGRVISTGGGILLRPQNLEALREAGPVICLTADPATILERTGDDENRPLLQVADPAQRIAELLSERSECYAQADRHVSTDGRDPEAVVDAVIEALRESPRGRWHVGASTDIPLRLSHTSYQISVARGVLSELGRIVPPVEDGVRAALVSTDRIGPLYADTAREALEAAGWDVSVLTVPDGEASKQVAVAAELWEQMAASGLDRGSTVFALGGGVVGDLAGFAAATYMRGISLVHLPTSLLAQVDSSIGGKTAVDLGAGKNLVGAFHQPAAVVTDVATLATLPDAELRSGLGEIIKHACCFDAEMFAFLGERREAVLGGDGACLEYLVARNCQIKAQVVEQDPHEAGLRAVLNYGHTVGHALERAADEWSLRHGEVVGAGIVAEARAAVWLGLADEECASRQEALVAAYGLPTEVRGVSQERALQALERDKKIQAGRLRMPLVTEIGSFEIIENVNLDIVRRALLSVLA